MKHTNYDKTTGTACADCGAVFPTLKPGESGASGYAVTAVPRLPFAKVRTLAADGTNYGTDPAALPSPVGVPAQIPGGSHFPAVYDVEGSDAAYKADSKMHEYLRPQRKICYACCAVLERETLTARGKGCLYLAEKSDGAAFNPHTRQTTKGPHHYRYELSNWPGSAPFQILGRVRESHGYGFGRRYDVRTFSFVGPDGYVWSGRNAGDMQLARVKRTKVMVRQ